MDSSTTMAKDLGETEYKAFLDDPYNMAMYVVLPTMIVVYGGCCFIYCMAKLHRYCRRQARKKRHLKQKEDEKDASSDNNNGAGSKTTSKNGAVISVVDLTEPESESEPKPKPEPKPKRPKPVPYPKPFKVQRARTPAAPLPISSSAAPGTLSTPAVSPAARSPLASRVKPRVPVQAVRPGYQSTGNKVFQQQMQHLDEQLKAAFKLITNDPNKSKSRPDVCARSNENKKPVNKQSGVRSPVVSDQ